jgi:tetratricopeptide (TPR) repeat protein
LARSCDPPPYCPRRAEEFKAALQLVPSSSSALGEELRVRQLLCQSLSGPAIELDPLKQARDSIAVIPEVYNAIGIYYLESTTQNRAQAMDAYSEAIRAFREAKRLSPGWMYPRHNLALALIERGEYAAAEREYRQAIANQPLEPYVYYNLGLLLHRMNRKSEAITAYEEALKAYKSTAKELEARATDWQGRWPDDAALARQRMDVYNINSADVLNAWGILLASKRDLEARVKYYRALRINSDLCAARDNWAQFEQSVEEHRDPKAVSKGAMSLLNANLERPGCSAFYPSWLQRAKLRRRSEDLAGAREDFAEVHRLVPSNTEALTGMASVDAADGKYPSAIQLLNEAVAIEAEAGGVYPDVYAQMAEVYRQANNPAACRDAFEKAISSSRGAVYAVSARELRNRSARCGQQAER